MMNNATVPEIRKAVVGPYDERRERLLSHIEKLLPEGAQADAFREGMTTEPAAAIRLNTLMPAAGKIGDGLRCHATPVPWCAEAFVLAETERRCGSTFEHALGAV